MNKVSHFVMICALLLVGVVEKGRAEFVDFTFTSTADNGQFQNPYVDSVSFGDVFKVVVTANNGGSGFFGQNWSANDVVSVTYDFNNGAHRTVFNPNEGDGFSASTGMFSTNGLGQLTAVPTNWSDSGVVNVASTNSAQAPNAWYLNGRNDKYYTDSFAQSVGITNPVDNLNASNWTTGLTAVPEPSSFTLFGVGAILAAGRSRRQSRQRKVS